MCHEPTGTHHYATAITPAHITLITRHAASYNRRHKTNNETLTAEHMPRYHYRTHPTANNTPSTGRTPSCSPTQQSTQPQRKSRSRRHPRTPAAHRAIAFAGERVRSHLRVQPPGPAGRALSIRNVAVVARTIRRAGVALVACCALPPASLPSSAFVPSRPSAASLACCVASLFQSIHPLFGCLHLPGHLAPASTQVTPRLFSSSCPYFSCSLEYDSSCNTSSSFNPTLQVRSIYMHVVVVKVLNYEVPNSKAKSSNSLDLLMGSTVSRTDSVDAALRVSRTSNQSATSRLQAAQVPLLSLAVAQSEEEGGPGPESAMVETWAYANGLRLELKPKARAGGRRLRISAKATCTSEATALDPAIGPVSKASWRAIMLSGLGQGIEAPGTGHVKPGSGQEG